MNEIYQLINPTNTMSVNRLLAHALGMNEAFIYSSLISKFYYYSERGMLNDGWFYSTIPDLQESTTLLEKQQKRAIDNLVKAGLIKCELRGMPAKRSFYIIEDIELINRYIAAGEEKTAQIKPAVYDGSDRKRGKDSADISPCSAEMAEQASPKQRTMLLQNGEPCSDKTAEHIYKTKDNKSKVMNPNQSIPQSANEQNEKIDRETESQIAHTTETVDYPAIIKSNIDYDWFYKNRKTAGLGIDMPKVDEIYSIMCDVVCSRKQTIRVNGEEMPAEKVKQRFLQLKGEHIEYVIDAMKNNPNEIRNIRAYWITALYNAPATMDSYYGETEKRISR